MQIKSNILQVLKHTGGFGLARKATTSRLRILCYHGISLLDEHEYLPKLFISPVIFRQRMEILERSKMHVLPLSKALTMLDKNTLCPNSVVITIDDGWFGVCAYALDVLNEYRFPSTLYSTTYYSCKGTMVFNVALRYMLEKSEKESLQLGALGVGLSGKLSLEAETDRSNASQKLSLYADSMENALEREQFLSQIASILRIDYDEMHELRMFTLMTLPELQQAQHRGMDVQLHTHRHTELDGNAHTMKVEIADNRRVLEPLLDTSLSHFCYPSGVTGKESLSVLRELDISSAVTCEAGFNTKETDKLLLRRFLDGGNISKLEFEAEMSGMLEVARRVRAYF